MSQTTYLLPITFVRPFQDPQPRNDAPAGGAQPGQPGATDSQGHAGTQVAPNGPGKAPAPSPCGDDGLLWMMPVFLLLMYFMMIRPEQKRRREQQALLASIKVGDHVVTLSGLHGEVSGLTEKTVTLRVDTIQMTFDRTAVSRIERDDAPADNAK